MKYFAWILVAVVFFAAGWLVHYYLPLFTLHSVGGYFNSTPNQNETSESSDNGQVCAQVITPARNPKTGDIAEFPTPCDVPEGWVVIVNDVPGL